MDNQTKTPKDKFTLQKSITISVVVAILFTAGFLLGAVTAKIREIPLNVNVALPVVATTTQAPVTVPETTTAAPTTTEAPTTTLPPETTTEETTTAETTTAPAEETEEDEPCCIVKILITVIEFFKQILDFILSFLTSL